MYRIKSTLSECRSTLVLYYTVHRLLPATQILKKLTYKYLVTEFYVFSTIPILVLTVNHVRSLNVKNGM